MRQQNATIDLQQVCAWLGLPKGCWPPDHYTLLGLQPGETDMGRIEQQVHERSTRVRCYQLCNPMLATEAMTQLAKAFDCLTSPTCKKAYDAAHFPHLIIAPPVVPSSRVRTAIASDTVETTAVPAAPATQPPPKQSPIQWQSAEAPPPVRQELETVLPPVPLPSPDSPTPLPVAVQTPVAAPASPEKHKLLALPPAAMQRLDTRRELFDRLVWIRQLILAWERAGKYLAKPNRRLSRPAEATDLARLLQAIDDLLQALPGLLCQPGQPGYRVVALTSLGATAERFKAMDDAQREMLALDYRAGHQLLDEYRDLLMTRVKDFRCLTLWQRCRRDLDAGLNAYWALVLVVLGFTVGLGLVLAWFAGLADHLLVVGFCTFVLALLMACFRK